MKKKIVDEARVRSEGEFFTPKGIIDLTHEYIENALGENWKDEYVVFDPACGHCNLTRDYKFKELYCSTLNDHDVKHNIDNNYNPEATHFQFNFLEDSDDKLPAGLKAALIGDKKLLIIMNPPYVSGATGPKMGNRPMVYKTKVAQSMSKNKWSGSSDLMYQFIYNSYMLTETKGAGSTVICPIIKTGLLTANALKKFRAHFFSRFSITSGFTFCSSHFSGTSSIWGVVTLVMPNTPRELPEGWRLTVIDDDLKPIGMKTYYNLDLTNNSLYQWARL